MLLRAVGTLFVVFASVFQLNPFQLQFTRLLTTMVSHNSIYIINNCNNSINTKFRYKELVDIIRQAAICNLIDSIFNIYSHYKVVVQVEIVGNFWKMQNVFDNDFIVTVDPFAQIQCFWYEIKAEILVIQKLQERLITIEMIQLYIHIKLMYMNLIKITIVLLMLILCVVADVVRIRE